MLYLTAEKKEAYRLECIAAKSGVTLTRAGGGVVVEFDHLNSLVHKLIHAASVHVLEDSTAGIPKPHYARAIR